MPAFNFADAFATTTFFSAVGFFTVAGFVVAFFSSESDPDKDFFPFVLQARTL